MYNFFVLGQIPGTTIIITFTMWLELGLLVVALGIYLRVHNRRTVAPILLPTISEE